MQTPIWYYRRLKVMSPSEIAWRTKSSVRDRFDRMLVSRRQQWRRPSEFLTDHSLLPENPVGLCPIEPGADPYEAIDPETARIWRQRLVDRADRIAEHRLDFFDLANHYLQHPIAWNRDHKLRLDTPMTYCSRIDYRDINETGDCKFVWEPNRHHQFVVLARAFRVTGDRRYAEAVAEQLDSWLAQNPFGVGMNWRSGLELAVRLINWVWTLELLGDCDAISDDLRTRILDSASRHIWEIDRKYSRGSSVNNHLIGEAAGAYIASTYFAKLKNAARWRSTARAILEREIINQTHADGGTVEQATGYHLFVLQFFTIAALTGRAAGRDFSPAYMARLAKMYEFIGVLAEGGDGAPAFGDADDGYVLDLSDEPRKLAHWMAVAAAMFARTDFKAFAGQYSQTAQWLLGPTGRERFESINPPEKRDITSRAFRKSGYYLLQTGRSDSADRISIIFDCGPLGMAPLAGHGHADALSFTLRAFGKDILVDPGTYDYFSYPRYRRYFRSTPAHNTVTIDGLDQSQMLGLFLWSNHASARCLDFERSPAGTTVVGTHNGYRRLSDPVTHRRTLDFDAEARRLTIRDDIAASANHQIELNFHLADHCKATLTATNRYLIDAGEGTVAIELDRRLTVEPISAGLSPIRGWVSRQYHCKQPATTLTGRCSCRGDISLVCTIEISKPREKQQQ